MARRFLEHWAIGITAGTALLTQAPAPAAAEPPADSPLRAELAPQVLYPSSDDLNEHRSWLSPNFHLHKSGVGYTQHFRVSDRPFVFKVQGPVMRKQKALGLTFAIRF
jgi:hypothetical protein